MNTKNELWLPPSVQRQHKKAPPPQTGDAFGAWAGRDVQYLTMPGGAVLGFDLERLTLADFRTMRGHYQINVSLSVLTFMMSQIDWHIRCDDDKQLAQKIEANLRERWLGLMRSIGTSYWAGYAPTAIEWANTKDGILIKRFKDLIPEECTVHWKKVKGYAPPGHPAPTFFEYDGIDQRGVSFPIPPENTFWYPLLMEGGNYYGRKLLKPAFPSWFFSVLIHLFANRYFERFGEPVPIGRYDEYSDVTNSAGQTVTGREAMEEILTNLRSRSVVTLPSDRDSEGRFTWDIDYLESQMRGADFERYLYRLDEEMSLAVFTPTLLIRTADVGSYNLGVGHMQMYLWLLNALAGDMKDFIDQHIVQRMVSFNHAAGVNGPKAEWVPRPMGKQQADLLRSVVTELVRGGSAKPDLEELGDAIGLSLTEVRQLTEPDPEDGIDVDPSDDEGARNRTRSRSKPGGTERVKVAAARMVERVQHQSLKAWRNGTFGNGFRPEFGFRRQVTAALIEEGADERTADDLTVDLFGRLESWASDQLGLGRDAFSGPDEFVSRFARALEAEVERLA